MNENFQRVGAVIVSKMNYKNRAGLLLCVWRRENTKPGILRVQTWSDVRRGTPRTEPDTAQTSTNKVMDMITVSCVKPIDLGS